MTVQVFARHIRAAKLCTRGARAWFLANDLDWDEFLTSGLDSDTLLALNDPLARRAVEAAEKEEE